MARQAAAKVFESLWGCTIPKDFPERIIRGEPSELVDVFTAFEAAIRTDERERLETRFWSITDPNSVPSDMWDALDRMASAYRARTTPEIGREE
jgi:hypothetical protein